MSAKQHASMLETARRLISEGAWVKANPLRAVEPHTDYRVYYAEARGLLALARVVRIPKTTASERRKQRLQNWAAVCENRV